MKAALAWARTWTGEHSVLGDYLELTKPSVTSLILMSTLVGYYMGIHGSWSLLALLNTILGTMLIAAGTAAMNHYLEIESDGRMLRTENRPLPAGRLRPSRALAFALTFVAAGALYLALAVNLLTSALGLVTWASYLFLYTPLKRRTSLCTLVGAFPGSFPILMGWTAARGTLLDSGGWLLYAILFLWQFPHFLAIAWMYREDYARGGILMLPVLDLPATVRQILGFSLVLIPVSLLPTVIGLTGKLYFAGAAAMGVAFFYSGVRLARKRTAGEARRLLKASVLYLPLLYALLMLDKVS
jgi:protoheme IX farnesyltransferase